MGRRKKIITAHITDPISFHFEDTQGCSKMLILTKNSKLRVPPLLTFSKIRTGKYKSTIHSIGFAIVSIPQNLVHPVQFYYSIIFFKHFYLKIFHDRVQYFSKTSELVFFTFPFCLLPSIQKIKYITKKNDYVTIDKLNHKNNLI